MIHPHTRLLWVDDEVGHGVFATHPIPKGTITWVRDPLDRLLTEEDIPHLSERWRPLIERYSYVTGTGHRLLAWDFCRFMNHSCEANTFSPGLDLEIAVRDIEVGEQLTSDYAALNLEEGFRCLCRAPACRGWVSDEQFEPLAPRWDTLVRDAFPRIPAVTQPLWDLLADEIAVLRGVSEPEAIPSVLSNRFTKAAPVSGRRVAV